MNPRKKSTFYEIFKKLTNAKTLKKKTAAKKTIKSRKKVSAIPKGYNSITPYLIVNNAAKAIDFYKKAFAAKVVLCLQRPDGQVSHAELKMGDSKIMLADEHPEMGARGPQAFGGSPVSIHLYVKKVDAMVEKAHSAGAKIVRPITDMFYGDRSATLADPFGHQWTVSTHIENVTNPSGRVFLAQQKDRLDHIA